MFPSYNNQPKTWLAANSFWSVMTPCYLWYNWWWQLCHWIFLKMPLPDICVMWMFLANYQSIRENGQWQVYYLRRCTWNWTVRISTAILSSEWKVIDKERKDEAWPGERSSDVLWWKCLAYKRAATLWMHWAWCELLETFPIDSHWGLLEAKFGQLLSWC